MSPTQRSLKRLRDEGYTVAITERWNPFARVRQDLFGFADLLAMKSGEILAVQTTTASHFAEHRRKINSEARTQTWLAAGGRIQLHGWNKSKVKVEVITSE
jgi:hypothetical protein